MQPEKRPFVLVAAKSGWPATELRTERPLLIPDSPRPWTVKSESIQKPVTDGTGLQSDASSDFTGSSGPHSSPETGYFPSPSHADKTKGMHRIAIKIVCLNTTSFRFKCAPVQYACPSQLCFDLGQSTIETSSGSRHFLLKLRLFAPRYNSYTSNVVIAGDAIHRSNFFAARKAGLKTSAMDSRH